MWDVPDFHRLHQQQTSSILAPLFIYDKIHNFNQQVKQWRKRGPCPGLECRRRWIRIESNRPCSGWRDRIRFRHGPTTLDSRSSMSSGEECRPRGSCALLAFKQRRWQRSADSGEDDVDSHLPKCSQKLVPLTRFLSKRAPALAMGSRACSTAWPCGS